VDDDESSPSHYDNELPDIRFDLSVDQNTARISPAIINRGITVSGRMVVYARKPCLTDMFNQLLASTFKGRRAARHLLVVAASSPLEVNIVSGGCGAPEWQRIAQKLQEVFFFPRPLHI